jgi:hypothetical protein
MNNYNLRVGGSVVGSDGRGNDRAATMTTKMLILISSMNWLGPGLYGTCVPREFPVLSKFVLLDFTTPGDWERGGGRRGGWDRR